LHITAHNPANNSAEINEAFNDIGKALCYASERIKFNIHNIDEQCAFAKKIGVTSLRAQYLLNCAHLAQEEISASGLKTMCHILQVFGYLHKQQNVSTKYFLTTQTSIERVSQWIDFLRDMVGYLDEFVPRKTYDDFYTLYALQNYDTISRTWQHIIPVIRSGLVLPQEAREIIHRKFDLCANKTEALVSLDKKTSRC
jgi:hypothetical protein